MRRARFAMTTKDPGKLMVGYDATTNTTLGTSQRWFINVGSGVKTAGRTGTLTTVNFVSPAATTAVFCTGVWDGTFVVRDFESVSVALGANTLPVSLSVQAGDYLAVYFATIRNPNRQSVVSDSTIYYSASGTAPAASATITGWNNGGAGALDLWGTD